MIETVSMLPFTVTVYRIFFANGMEKWSCHMDFIKKALKGIIIGLANAVPGVSGGTMMVSMGIYDDIIFCITHIFKQLKKSLSILFPYIVGMVVGIVGLAYAIGYLQEHHPLQTSLTFIGLILGGIPILWKRIRGTDEKKNALGIPQFLVFFFFFAMILVIQYFGGSATGEVKLTVGILPMIMMFIVGIIASATMVIPGVSGSMILMIMGYYYPIINAIKSFVDGAVHRDWETVLTLCASLVPFGIGVVLGIFLIAKLIEFLLNRFESLTYSAIMGLVVASPVVVLMGTPLAGVGVVAVATGLICFLAGGLVALKLGD